MIKNNGFSFGRNWQKYLNEAYAENKLQIAMASLKAFMNINTFKSKSFIDIGCGSGIFSLAAYRLGAKNIFSFDIDPRSVNCCRTLKEKENNPSNWTVCSGSILDNEFISKLSKHDIVYSWGVLHHTGNMRNAIENTGNLVKPKGYLYIAIYNKAHGLLGSKFWVKIKQMYNYSPRIIKQLMETGYIFIFVLHGIILLQNPFKQIKDYSYRGMNWRRDISDWLGGYPYEYANVDEIFNFCKTLEFRLINLRSTDSLGNNEFLFKKTR